MYEFEKNVHENITDNELNALREIAESLLARDDAELNFAVEDGTLEEICHGN